jgi:sec-independent protein translocase protein TatA
MSIGFWQILIIVAIILLLFGRNKISELMGDLGRGVSNFKKGLSEDKSGKPEKKTSAGESPAKKPKG